MIPWTVIHQAPLFMEFFRQIYCSELLFSTPGDLPEPGIKPASPALAGRFFYFFFFSFIFISWRLITLQYAGRFFITASPGKPIQLLALSIFRVCFSCREPLFRVGLHLSHLSPRKLAPADREGQRYKGPAIWPQ